MYNAYGHHVYKKYQVNMGNPYPVRPMKNMILKQERKESPAEEKNPEEEGKKILEKAGAEAERIVQEANREANDILERAQEKVMAHMLEVEQSAKEEGYRTGEDLARQHYQGLLDEAENLREKAQEVYEKTVISLEGEIVETILDIARKVIGMEMEHNREAVLGLVRTTLLGSASAEDLVVRVCPEDYDYVCENKEKLKIPNKSTKEIIIKQDSSLKKGECLIENGFGSVDGSIEIQLDGIECAFKERLGHQQDEEPPSLETEGAGAGGEPSEDKQGRTDGDRL